MKKMKLNKKILVLMAMISLFVLAGCQRNVDANGVTLPEKVISLLTPWKDMLDESFFTAILVYPLSQLVNFIGKYTTPFIGVAATTIIFNILVLPLSIKTTVQTQQMQMIQPEMQKIQEKYAGKDDEHSKLQQAQEMQNLYNKYNMNPLGSILMPFLQFPILIAMYYAVQRADVVVNGKFAGVPLSTTPAAAFKSISTGWPIVVVFVLMAISQLLSSKIPTWAAEYKRKHSKDYRSYKDKPAANSQANMMIYGMVGMVILIGLRWPAAMSVYWLINSIINVVKTIYIQWRYVD